ncbi:MAG: four helix bundle protein [Planctomycetota bacterium]
MSALRSYRDLEVWKKSIDLVEAIYLVSRAFPPEEISRMLGGLKRSLQSRS